MRIPFLLGRLIFGGYFVTAGINHFRKTQMMSQYASMKHVPKPELAVRASGAMLIVGGASILLGVKPKLGAAALVGFLAGVSPVMHNFWKQENSEQRMHDMVDFTKNVALAGGAIALMGVEEPWPNSVPVLQPSGSRRIARLLRNAAA